MIASVVVPIRAEVERRGITRLCHFTPSRNLAHIALDPRGMLASRHLEEDEKAVFNPTDSVRLDGYSDHLCCSIQYPNAWYFRKARENERLFPDWVVVFIDSRYLWQAGVKFCPRNAAASSGRFVREGATAFSALFAQSVAGSSRNYDRGPNHPDFLPTDEQAEVLIPDVVEHQDIIGVAVRDEAQARRELARLKMLGRKPPPIFVAREFYSPGRLSTLLRAGQRPAEVELKQGETDEGA